MNTCTARPGHPPRLIDAPPGLGVTFLAWLASGRAWEWTYELTCQLYQHRNTWLICGEYVFYLTPDADARLGDAIRVVPRSLPLEVDLA